MLINADHTALEDAVIALNGIGIDVSTGFTVVVAILFARMVNRAVVRELIAKLRVAVSFIGHYEALSLNVGADYRHNDIFGCALKMKRTGLAAALNQSQNRVFMPGAPFDLKAILAAYVGFIDFNGIISPTHWRKISAPHCLSDTMGEEPSGFHAAREHALNLVGGDAFFAGAHQMDNLEPQMQRKVGTFKDSSLLNSELTLAFVAFVEAKASGLALHLADTVGICVAAMRANRTMRPKPALHIRESGFLVDEVRGVKNGSGHGNLLWPKPTS